MVLRSQAFSCGGSHVVKFKSYKELKAVAHLMVRFAGNVFSYLMSVRSAK
jgi:hypothetical protein